MILRYLTWGLQKTLGVELQTGLKHLIQSNLVDNVAVIAAGVLVSCRDSADYSAYCSVLTQRHRGSRPCSPLRWELIHTCWIISNVKELYKRYAKPQTSMYFLFQHTTVTV